MTRVLFAICAACLFVVAPAGAQEASSVAYQVSFENAAHHEAKITISFRDIGEAPLELRMSRSSPGRYAIHEFAKNVYAVAAVNGAGETLGITRTNPYSWRVEGHDGSVTLTYTLYADLREWRIGDGADRQTIRLALHHDGNKEDLDIFAAKAKNVVAEHIKLFGEAPDFDDGVYTFIADYLPYMEGDGMEHRNSTILTQNSSLFEKDFSQLGTLSHEFFHAWNVERLRPTELEPFDFSAANPTPSLWFAEGFTSYYGSLMIRRAGEGSVEEFLTALNRRFDTVLNGPGRQFDSPQRMSLRAPFADAATAVDPTNFSNTFVSYYSYGAVIALALDLTIRQRFEDLSLDHYMRRLWQTHGKTETPYAHADLRKALGDITGDDAFANEFFARFIEGAELPDFAPLLAQAGLKAQRKNEGDAWLGKIALIEDGRELTISANTRIGSPLYEAGLDRGDEIIRIGRFKIDDKGDWKRALKRHKPGDTATITYHQRGSEKKSLITFTEDETLEIVAIEEGDDDAELTDAQKAFRDAWLGPDSNDDGSD